MEESRITEIFSAIEGMDVELSKDPLVAGPKALQTAVASCRNYTNEVQSYLREVTLGLRMLRRELRTLEAAYELEFNTLLATDPEVVALRKSSRQDREAVIITRLQSDYVEIQAKTIALDDFSAVETVISTKLKDLRDVMSSIRLQRDIIKAELELGGEWGIEDTLSNTQVSAETHTEVDDYSGDGVGFTQDLDAELRAKKAFPASEPVVLDSEELDFDALFGSSVRNTTTLDVDNVDSELTFKSESSTVTDTSDEVPFTASSDQDAIDQALADLG
jgi:hypothetical protein